MRARGGQLVILLAVATNCWALDQKDLGNALRGLQKLTNFFRSDATSLNPDALFGLRLGQGQLDVITRVSQEQPLLLPTTLVEEITRMSERVNETAILSYPSIQRNEGSYFQSFKPIIIKPFPAFFTKKHVFARTGKAPDQTWKEYDEKRGDACYTEILDSGEGEARSEHCAISDSCWAFMNRPQKHGYALTHQMLYFMLARTFCGPEVSRRIVPRTIDDAFQNKCQNIYEDSAALSQGDYVGQSNRDLFAEQILLCAVSGFDEFLTSRTLNLILSWQDESIGCFPKMNWIDRMTYSEYAIKRKKRNEVIMKSGCLGHISGLAAGVLGAYVRKAAMDVYQIS